MADIQQIYTDKEKTNLSFPISVAAAIFTGKDKKKSLLAWMNSIPFAATEEDGFFSCDSEENYVFSIVDGTINASALADSLLEKILDYMKTAYLNDALANVSDVGEGQNIVDLDATTNTDNLYVEVYDEDTLSNKKVNLKTFIQSIS